MSTFSGGAKISLKGEGEQAARAEEGRKADHLPTTYLCRMEISFSFSVASAWTFRSSQHVCKLLGHENAPARESLSYSSHLSSCSTVRVLNRRSG